MKLNATAASLFGWSAPPLGFGRHWAIPRRYFPKPDPLGFAIELAAKIGARSLRYCTESKTVVMDTNDGG